MAPTWAVPDLIILVVFYILYDETNYQWERELELIAFKNVSDSIF